jgi:putative hydrolases of HD superfamily
MQDIVKWLFEARLLKEIPRSGFAFLGAGRESVAEHSFSTTLIAYVMAQLEPQVDALRLMSMCLLHDLPEARTGDLNYVQRRYVTADEERAAADSSAGLPEGPATVELLAEFRAGRTLEARLAHDADQLSFMLGLKALADMGYLPPRRWLAPIPRRLVTELGQSLAREILKTDWDAWWQDNIIDTPGKVH